MTQCYGQKNNILCNEYPSSLTINDIVFENFGSTASGHYDPLVGNIVCSSPDVCGDIVATNTNVVDPEGNDAFTCSNVDDGRLAVNCTTIIMGYN